MEATKSSDQISHPEAGQKARRLIGEKGSYLLNRVQGETGENISACYQCERCTNACPVSYYMDIKPHQVIRYIQLGWREELMNSSTIWVCLSCEMCTTYCPNEVGVAETINHLRTVAAHSSIQPKERQLALFHHTFMTELQRFGRVNEFWLMNAFNLKPGVMQEKVRKGQLLDELILGLTLWRKGRLNLIPHRSKAIKEIKKLYRAKQGDPS
jgi:heterodisulfide reductase subunit C2